MTIDFRLSRFVLAAALGAAVFAAGAADANKWPATRAGEPTPKVTGIPPALAKNLANFDDLDFRVYTNQQWQDFHKTHTKDVIVHCGPR